MYSRLLNNNPSYTNRWIVPYADFITMLLALFTVMYALSQMSINNLREFSDSLENAFSLPPGQTLAQAFSTTEMKVSVNEKNAVKQEIAEFDSIKRIVTEKLNNLKDVSITRESRGLLIRLSNGVLFDTGSDIIKGESIALLDGIARALKDAPNSVRIEGHTDDVPINTEKFPSNWELSTSRATNIVRYFIEKHNFRPAKLSAIGYGEYMPVAENDSGEGKALNRRVDIVILSSSYNTE